MLPGNLKGFLFDKEVFKSILKGTCDITTDLGNATELILEENWKMRTMLSHEEGQ